MKLKLSAHRFNNLLSLLLILAANHNDKKHKNVSAILAELSNDDLSNLERFKKILPAFEKVDTETLFLSQTEKDSWHIIKQILNKKEIYKFEIIIANFAKSFDKIWKNEEPRLQKYLAYFKKNDTQLQKIMKVISVICGVKKFSPTNVPIYLIRSWKYEDLSAWFSWTPTRQSIVVECGKNIENKKYFAVSVLAHEFFHLAIRKNKKIMREIDRCAKKHYEVIDKLSDGMPPRIFLEELIVSSFIPEGYLSKKYFKIPIKKTRLNNKDILNLRRYVAYKMEKIARHHVIKKEPISEKYIHEILKIINVE